jgi:hypothetical protein
MSPKKKSTDRPQVDAARLADILFKAEYIDKKHLYFQNFVRGITFGAGSVIGATVVIALAAWILSLFDTIPLIGPLIENTRETIKQS